MDMSKIPQETLILAEMFTRAVPQFGPLKLANAECDGVQGFAIIYQTDSAESLEGLRNIGMSTEGLKTGHSAGIPIAFISIETIAKIVPIGVSEVEQEENTQNRLKWAEQYRQETGKDIHIPEKENQEPLTPLPGAFEELFNQLKDIDDLDTNTKEA